MMAWPEAPGLEVEDFTSVPSWDLHGELAYRLAQRARDHATRAEIAGVVVPHGTDTMEENVYLIDLMLGESRNPVVMTGAQRAASESGRRRPSQPAGRHPGSDVTGALGHARDGVLCG